MTLVVLIVGLWLFGTGEALLVDADLGVSPWTVFAQGLSERFPISIGLATLLTSAAVLALWIPLRERPGLGTIANAVVIAVSLEVMSTVLPTPDAALPRILMVVGSIALIGLGSGLYLTANLGPGPRDGWMTGIHRHTGWPVTAVRLTIEATVLIVGWLLGGTVGLGTVAFATLVGPSVGYGLRLCGWIGRTAGGGVSGAPGPPVDDGGHPELEA